MPICLSTHSHTHTSHTYHTQMQSQPSTCTIHRRETFPQRNTAHVHNTHRNHHPHAHTHHTTHTRERITSYSLLFFPSDKIINKEYKYSVFLNRNIVDFQNYVSFQSFYVYLCLLCFLTFDSSSLL